ncbi:HAD family hydrolase [Lactiplantibacillus daowaiensis]|uniref:HAD family hydrolase n=1 Tax=Lactiplantibacillus daowaiensis TaxID=2559918 RepID=A0ABW1S2R6_9LACO|nr:HAD family hydrolase [Lactiplantibacillus daowaiensis]
MIKYLFADLDGTLLDPTGKVNATTAQAVQERGLPVTLVSARAPMEMQAAVDALKLTGPQIAFNGGLIYERQAGKMIPLQMHPMKHSRAEMLLNFIKNEFPGVSLSCYTRDNWYTERIDGGVRHEQRLTGQPVQVTSYDDLMADADQRIFKITVITLDFKLISALAAALKKLNYPDISAKLSGLTYLEITSDAAQKSRGIHFIQAQYQLAKAELAAIGDSENDLPMFAQVGMPIVMGNAAPDIQAVSPYVTKSNAEDGVAYAFQTYLKKE